MKNFFYLLFLAFVFTSCNEEHESLPSQDQHESLKNTDFSLLAKTNMESATSQEAYINQQLEALALSGSENNKTSENIAGNLGNVEEQAKFYNNLGNEYFLAEQYNSALIYYFSSLQLKVVNNNMEGMAISFRNIALTYQALGDYSNAALNFWQSLYLWETLGNDNRKAQLFNDLGVIYDLAHDFISPTNFEVESSLSLSYYTQSLNINESINNLAGAEQVEYNVSLLFATWNDRSIVAREGGELSRDQDDVEDEL